MKKLLLILFYMISINASNTIKSDRDKEDKYSQKEKIITEKDMKKIEKDSKIESLFKELETSISGEIKASYVF